MRYRHIIILFFITTALITCYSQSQSGAIKFCEKAKKELNQGNLEKATIYLKKAILKDSTYFESYWLMGDIKNVSVESCEAAWYYNQAIRYSNHIKPIDYIKVAGEEVKCGEYELAYHHYQQYLEIERNPELMEEIEENLVICQFGMEAIKHPVNMDPINMGSNVNTLNDEYLATLTADEMEIIYTVRRPRDENTACVFCTMEEDFYRSERINGEWQPCEPLGSPINTSYNEGAQTISPDGRYLFFTLCNAEQGYGSCDLYWSKRIGNRWSRPRNFGTAVNTAQWESQPTISPNGKTIYFASNRSGGMGGFDLWKTEMISEGVFSVPENLGNIINTKHDDTAPFIHPDGKTLYFASNGHPGMGGRDLFYSILLADSTWGKPINMGYPINTSADELNIFINATGTTAYYASDKDGGYGGLDLYYFSLDEHLRPTPVTYMKGRITDKENNKPMEATIELIDLTHNKLITSTTSDPITGEFIACILTGSNLLLNISHPFYLFYSENFKLTESTDSVKPVIKDIHLQKPEVGSVLVMHNIFFEYDKSILKDESYIELDYLVHFLEKNPEIKIEISGHTDNQGDEDYNYRLSIDRAKSVYNYLINKNINSNRLQYSGYGESHPIAENDTEQGRSQNRRTEIKIIEN